MCLLGSICSSGSHATVHKRSIVNVDIDVLIQSPGGKNPTVASKYDRFILVALVHQCYKNK